jgi:hypothetical protein
MERGQQIEYLKKLIPQHQDYVNELKDKALPLWGVPHSYYCHLSPCDILVLAPDGRVILQITEPVKHDGAVLKIGNQVIAGVENQ